MWPDDQNLRNWGLYAEVKIFWEHLNGFTRLTYQFFIHSAHKLQQFQYNRFK